MKKIVVAGCRNYNDYKEAKIFIEFCLNEIGKENKVVFLSGGCRGADMLGERYAKENGYEIIKYNAEWDKYGAAAGPKRNLEMATACDYVICFWDGKSRGTASMIKYANKYSKPIKIKYITTG